MTDDRDDDVGLADAIEVIRRELTSAQDRGRDRDVRFSVGAVEVELAVEVVKKAGADTSVKVLGVLSLGGKGEVGQTTRNRIKIVLNPIGVGGRPFEVSSQRSGRPDGT